MGGTALVFNAWLLPLPAQDNPTYDIAGVPAIMGSGNFSPSDVGATLSQKIGALKSAGAMMARVALTPPDFYSGGKAGVSPATQTLVNNLIAQGIIPYLHFEYYQNQYQWGPGPILSYNWSAIGAAFASCFGTKVSYYSAINEPDMASGSAVIPPADYATALGDLASGIHSVVPTAKVIPGGYGSPSSYHDWSCRGYAAAIAPLLSSGALDGIDLHMYWGADDYTPITIWDITSQDSEFQHVKKTCGLGDIKLYCTEFNQNITGSPDPVINETQAAQRLLTLIWSVLGTTKNDHANPATQIALPWSIVEQESSYGLFTKLSPWTPNPRGKTLQLVLSLTAGMQLNTVSPAGCTLTSSKKKLWVIQNISSWVPAPSETYTCTGIPSYATELRRYEYDGLKETVLVPDGATTYTFNDIPTGETTMILAVP